MDYVSEQKKKMELIFKETFENKENLVDLFYGREYPKNEDEKNVNVSIYGESIIRDSHKILLQKLLNFNDDLYNRNEDNYPEPLYNDRNRNMNYNNMNNFRSQEIPRSRRNNRWFN